MRKITSLLTFFILLGLNVSAQNNYDDLSWPRELSIGKYIVTLYQPQLENFEGNKLDGRMAVSIKADDEMFFGAVWISSIVSTDTESRIVTLEKVGVPKIRFPDIENEERLDRFSTMLEEEIESWEIEMSLDRLIASMNDLESKKSDKPKFNNTPPDIYYKTAASSLISIDGDPVLKKDDEFSIEYVVNTAFFVAKEKDKYFIKSGKFWYTSSKVTSEYSTIDKVSKNVQGFADKYGSEIELDSVELAKTEAPELIVVTKPSELISTDGEAEYSSIEGTGLLFATNTEDDIILDIESQEHYILIAGRWYHTKSLENGEWKFAEPEDLPEDFAIIPSESDIANVRVSVPNTDEAQDALLEQSIPQTAKVSRDSASVEVTYDGDPQFEKIEGTSMSYAINTEKTVLLIDKKYYCVDDAIWFVSSKATGPWEVSTTRPDEVADIPPESPVYNVTYVYVYESTPEVVYVGYYPGYTYSYVYGGVVVYGTGYYYPYWYGAYYYPRPVTYGFGVHYNPWTGWGFSFGVSVGWGYHPYGYWGPRGYRYGYRRGYNRGYRHGYNRGYSQGARAGYAAGKRSNSNNVYSNRGKGVSSSDRANAYKSQGNKSQGDRASKAKASTKQNNMYTDRSGNVHQQNKDGSWENKNKGSTRDNTASKDQASNKASTRDNTASREQASNKASNQGSREQSGKNQGTRDQAASKNNNQGANKSNTQSRSGSSQQQLDRASQNRSRGNQNYNRTQSSRSGGASRGGGGGGRRR